MPSIQPSEQNVHDAAAHNHPDVSLEMSERTKETLKTGPKDKSNSTWYIGQEKFSSGNDIFPWKTG